MQQARAARLTRTRRSRFRVARLQFTAGIFSIYLDRVWRHGQFLRAMAACGWIRVERARYVEREVNLRDERKQRTIHLPYRHLEHQLGPSRQRQGIFPDAGQVICPSGDSGHPRSDGAKKVLLWSKRPWAEVDPIGSPALPGGRFVRGETLTASGLSITVVGVCIPWHYANVADGRMNRRQWEENEMWIEEFQVLRHKLPGSKAIVLGTFNHRIPYEWGKKVAYQNLRDAFRGWEIATEGDVPGASRKSIDHIAHTPDLGRSRVAVWPEREADGKPRTTYFGIWGDFGIG